MLRVQAVKFTIDLLYAGEIDGLERVERFGGERFAAEVIRDRKELAIASWGKFGDRLILRCSRRQATRSAPVKYHDIWIEAEGEVLAEAHSLGGVEEPAK
jgi:hypothetical protein